MANINPLSATFFLVLFLVASFVSSGVAAPPLCETPSWTWSGYCLITQDCDRQCQQWENAAHGACHWRGLTQMCFCYYTTCPSSKMHAKFIYDAKIAHHALAASPNPQLKN